MSDVVRVGTWNMWERGRVLPQAQRAARAARDAQQIELIHSLDLDVLLVQELYSNGDGGLHVLEELAEATGLQYTVDRGLNNSGTVEPALAPGDTGFCAAILWKPGIRAVPGSAKLVGRSNGLLAHSLASVVLDFDGLQLRFVSYLADPFRAEQRFSEMMRVIVTAHLDGVPCLIGGDFNGIGADRNPDGSYYDEDPYTDPNLAWFPLMACQLAWDDDPDAQPRADRRAAERLRRARVHDLAVVAGAPWQATTGHWAGDPHPPRRIDRFHATEHFTKPGVVHSYQLPDYPGITELSDHRPVVIELNKSPF